MEIAEAILANLLLNAIKHGTGPVHVGFAAGSVVISNPANEMVDADGFGLGLGIVHPRAASEARNSYNTVLTLTAPRKNLRTRPHSLALRQMYYQQSGCTEGFAMSRSPAWIVFIVVAVWSDLPAQVQNEGSNYHPPVARLAQYEFNDGRTLGVVSGAWATSGGTFNSTSAITAIATIDAYIPPSAFEEDVPEVNVDRFWFRARMLNQRSGASARVGLVYHYQDAANFYEVSFSPTGSVFVREVTDGVGTTVATGTYDGGGQNKRFDAEVEWTAAETIVRVNGLIVLRGVRQNAFTRGRVGLITRQTTARFDRLLVTREYGDPEFRESFSAGAPPWPVIKGAWSAVNGVYQNSAVQHGAITLLPIFVGLDTSAQTDSWTLYSRMLNPYGAGGNRMGFVFNYDEDDSNGSARYDEIVFGADGIARINEVYTFTGPGGATNVIETLRDSAPYPGARNQWFDVRFSGFTSIASDDAIDVTVNGAPVFTGRDACCIRGRIGLVTNWTPGRFDDVWFSHGPPFSVAETFERDNSAVWFALRGGWDTQGGVLNNRTAGVNDIVYTYWGRSTDYTVSARMLNPYSGPGNLIGLLFNFDYESGDYYEVVFSPTGQAYLNKFIQGRRTQVAAGTHPALVRNVWFTAELIREGTNATVKVNGDVVFANVPAAQLDNSLNSGRIGLVSHWSPGRFDDLRFEDFISR